jgi:Flp pilus assembly protein TadB
MRLPDSPEDRRRRDEALQRIGRHLAIAAVPCAVISLLVHALGVPWFVIAIFLALVAGSIVFES